MSKQYLITTIETCQECQGHAFLTHPAWEEYHEAIEQAPNVDRTLDPYDPETMERWFHDHGYEEIPDEEEICWACEGRGEVETTSSLDEALKDLLGERLGNAEQWIRALINVSRRLIRAQKATEERLENADQWIIALNDALTEAHHQRIINACGLTDGFVTDDDGNLVEGLVSAE